MNERTYHLHVFILIRWIRLFFLLFAVLLFSATGVAQQSIFTKLDTLTPERHSGEEFADAIWSIRKQYMRNQSRDSIELLNDYMDQLSNFFFKNNMRLRKEYARHALQLKKNVQMLEQAERYYLLAHQTISKEALKNNNWVWYVENPLATINNRLGDVEKSLYFYEVAEQALLHQKDKRISRLLYNKGILFKSQLKYEKAKQEFNKGMDYAQQYEFVLGMALNEINKNSLTILAGKYEEAATKLEQIEKYFTDKNIKAKIYDTYLNQMGQIHLAQGRSNEAIEYYIKELEYFNSIHSQGCSREHAKLYHEISLAYLKSSKWNKARSSVIQGLNCLSSDVKHIFIPYNQLYSENTFMELYGTLAKYYGHQYELGKNQLYLDSALLAYDYALLINDLLVAQYDTDESKYIATYNNKLEINGLFDIVWLKKQFGRPIEDHKLISYSQEAKSLVFDESLRNRLKFEELSKADKELYIDYQKNLGKLSVNFNISTLERTKERLRLGENMDQLIHDINTSDNLITSNYIDFIVSSEFVYAINNFNSELNLVKICHTKVADSVLTVLLDQVISEANIMKIRKSAKLLHRLLISPIGELPEEFSVISDGFLNHLPFDMLVDNKGDWLIKNHQISYRLSQKTLPGLKIKYNKVLCVTPDYGPQNQLLAYNRNDLYPLKYAKQEQEAIKKHFAQTNTLSAFSIDELQQNLSQYNVFHFSGHARVDELEGRLLLNENNKSITGVEISRLPSNLNLAVLSACETGLGKYKFGEGSMSLTRSFLSGGTRNVINSLWTVNDQSTAQLMEKFYGNLKSYKDPSRSLRDAKLSFIDEYQDAKNHPYHWAGFILTTVVDENHSTFNFSIRSLFGLLAVIFILFIIHHKTK